MIRSLGGYALNTVHATAEAVLPKKVMHAAETAGNLLQEHTPIVSIFERLGLKEPKSANVPPLPQEMLEKIAQDLDRKDRQNFSRASHACAKAAGSAIQELTFHGPHDLAYSSDLLKRDRALIGFSAHGIKHLKLAEHGPHEERYEVDTLRLMPDWMRQSVRTLSIEAMLSPDAWEYLKTFPNLQKIEFNHMKGQPNNEVLDHLPDDTTQLHLSMPLPPQEKSKLDRFTELKHVNITVKPGKTLSEILEAFEPPNATNEDDEAASEPVLQQSKIASLNFSTNATGPREEQRSNFEAADIDRLPDTLKALKLNNMSLMPGEMQRLHNKPLESLDMSNCILMSGDLLRVILDHPTLTEFKSFSSGLKTQDARAIANSPRLTKVEIPYNSAVGDQGITALTQNKNITHINIAHCGGSDNMLRKLYLDKPPHIEKIDFEL